MKSSRINIIHNGKHTPNEWELIELSSLVELEKGKYTPNKEEHVRCLELEHIERETGYILGYTDSALQQSIKSKFKRGQVLFGKLRPYLHKYWLAEYDGVCSSEIWVFKSITQKCTNEFIYCIVQSNHFVQVANTSTGSKMPRADWSYVSTFPFLLPPLPEQKAIAHILSLMDNAIHHNNQLIARKELRKKWLMQNLLTGRKRLKDFDGEWREVHIKDIAAEVSLRNKINKNLTVLSCTKHNGLVPSLEYFGRRIFSEDVSTYKIVPEGHFAYATNHIEEGSIGYQDLFPEALISPMYTVFKTTFHVDDFFFFRLLKSHHLLFHYNARMEGSIDRRGGLRWDAFSVIKIQIPHKEEQTAITQILQIADTEIQLLKKKTEKIKEQKKGLMQVLLTGKVRVGNAMLQQYK